MQEILQRLTKIETQNEYIIKAIDDIKDCHKQCTLDCDHKREVIVTSIKEQKERIDAQEKKIDKASITAGCVAGGISGFIFFTAWLLNIYKVFAPK